MIQRLQSVWMFFAAVIAFLTLTFPFYTGMYVPTGQFQKLMPQENILLLILTCALGTILIVNIFLFKNRKLQLRLCIVSLLVEILLLVVYMRETKNYFNGTFTFWAGAHIFIFAFIVASAMYINKDEKLIRQSNRLR
jgi:NADH:ubiquinone oxidoreductase subunit 2 (subunit N)